MASSMSLCLLLVATMSITIRAANEYKVGDSEGWRMPSDNDPGFYETWASKIKFLVGDAVVFEYHNDSVVKVNKRGYYHCNETSQGLLLNKDGSTVFLLDKPGFYYFVSGDVEHCKKGQRLMIEAVGLPLPPVVPAGPAPSPLPSAGVSVTVSSLVAAMAMGTFVCLTEVFTH